VLDAVLCIAEAWDKVNADLIAKCFAKAGFVGFALDQQENTTEDLLQLKIDSLLESLPSCRVSSGKEQ
jgi:hypothetical protein